MVAQAKIPRAAQEYAIATNGQFFILLSLAIEFLHPV